MKTDPLQLTPERVIGRRYLQKGDQVITQVQVLWKAHGMEDATWEEEAEFAAAYPDIGLEVESYFKGGSNDPSAKEKWAGPDAEEKWAEDVGGKGKRAKHASRRYPSQEFVMHKLEGNDVAAAGSHAERTRG